MAAVSVIVPVYNAEKYLKTSVGALRNQTLRDIEIILVDDGSTDGSGKLLDAFAKEDSRIKVIHKENGGQGSARNLGIKEAKGEYIGFADADDLADSTLFEKLYRKATEEDSDMAECRYTTIEITNGVEKGIPSRGNIRTYHSKQDRMIDPQVAPWNKIFRAEILRREGVDYPEGLIYEDTAFYLKTLPFIEKSSYVEESLLTYYWRDNSTMTKNRSKRVGDIFKVLDNILAFYQSNDFYASFEKELEYFCTKIVFCSSISRIGRIQDKALRRELLDESFDFVKTHFPNYRNNAYLQGAKGFYIKHLRRWFCEPLCVLAGKGIKG